MEIAKPEIPATGDYRTRGKVRNADGRLAPGVQDRYAGARRVVRENRANNYGQPERSMQLSELVNDGYMEKEDLNCAETMLYGADKVYDLGLDREGLKLAAGFGGGMGIEATCGALTGAVMVLGRIFARDKGHDTPRLKELCAEFLEEYRSQMGSIDCKPLKDRYRSEDLKCLRVVLKSAEILEQLIERESAG
jgi:C_GCAxxG_C_C family probable redox protein